MSENTGTETILPSQEFTAENNNKSQFLKATEASTTILNGLKLEGFQLGGGAIDFALGNYRRPHGDIDVVYIVDSINWNEFRANPQIIPDERQSLLQITQEPELFDVKQSRPIEMERMGAPGVRMEGGWFPIEADFIEAYRDVTGDEEFIMLPIYDGNSYIKIPSTEIRTAEIDGITTMVPSPEVQYILKEQASNALITLKGGLPPDRREKAKTDMEALLNVVDTQKVDNLKEKGVGFNFSAVSTLKFKANQLIEKLIK